MKLISLFVLLILAACSTTKMAPVETNLKSDVWKNKDGLLGPESTYYDKGTGLIFVSNVAGAPVKTTKTGYISIYSRSGKLLKKKWLSNLYGPKGLRSQGKFLYISDVNRVLKVDIQSGVIKKVYKIKEAKFLNDIGITKDGTLYISDMFANKIYQIKNGKVSTFLHTTNLESPNGLYVVGNDLYVAAWGADINQKNFTTKKPGRLLKVNMKTKAISIISGYLGNLDGIEIDKKGNFVLSDWVAGKIFYYNPNTNKTHLIYQGKQGVADIGLNVRRGRIYIPKMLENEISSIQL